MTKSASFFQSPESPVPIKDCLHPSEYDKASTLLICRSESKLKSEAFSVNVGSSGSGSDKYVIPFTQLGKFEDMQFHGKSNLFSADKCFGQ